MHEQARHPFAPGRLSRASAKSKSTRGQTSVQGVFAAGDVTTVPFKQIVIAVGEGANKALSAFDHLIRALVEDEAPAEVQESLAA